MAAGGSRRTRRADEETGETREQTAQHSEQRHVADMSDLAACHVRSQHASALRRTSRWSHTTTQTTTHKHSTDR